MDNRKHNILVDLRIGIRYKPEDDKRILNFLNDSGFDERSCVGMYAYYGANSKADDTLGTDDATKFSEILTMDEIIERFFNNNSNTPNHGSTKITTVKVRTITAIIRGGQKTSGKIVSCKNGKATIAIGHLSNRTIVGHS